MQSNADQSIIIPIERTPMNQEEFDLKFAARRRTLSGSQSTEQKNRTLRNAVKRQGLRCLKKIPGGFHRTMALFDGLKDYKCRDSVLNDVRCAAIIAMYRLAQALSYAVLAGIHPFHGIISAAVPPLVLSFFRTNLPIVTHFSLPSCFLIFIVIKRVLVIYSPAEPLYYATSIAVTLLLFSSLIQFCASISIRKHSICKVVLNFFPPHIVNGFCFGLLPKICFYHVIYAIQSKNDVFSAAFKSMPNVFSQPSISGSLNAYVASACVISMIVLLLAKLAYRTFFRSCILIPTNFIVLLSATVVSYFTGAEDRYGIKTLPNVTVSKINFVLPNWSVLLKIWPDILTFAIIAAAIHIYSVDRLLNHSFQFASRRELFSFGLVGTLGSFFGCLPQCASNELTTFASHHQAMKAITNFIAILLTVPFLFASHLLRHMPTSTLSCFIIFECINEAIRRFNFIQLWRTSRIDAAVWLLCAISSFVCVYPPHALMLCIFFGVCSLAVRLYRPNWAELVNVTGSGVYYAEKKQYGNDMNEETGIAIVKFSSPLLYANCRLLTGLLKTTASEIEWQGRNKAPTRNTSIHSSNRTGRGSYLPSVVFLNDDDIPICDTAMNAPATKIVILDCTAISDVDFVGAIELKRVFTKFMEKNIRLFFANASVQIRKQLESTGFFDGVPRSVFFPSVRDSVLTAQQILGTLNIHMSVSMNGCRELITLSGAPSNMELNDQRAASIQPRMYMDDARSLLSEASCMMKTSASNLL